ncbi:MAG: PorT family protein [Prevotellaceae bacterium]|jgi:hypothetical protein|nr:PorT family protein [Prevotellaceae bacterium]
MKKIVILTITAMVLTSGAFAQKKIEFGVKAGMNMAQEYTDDGSTNSRVAFHAGVFAEFFISNRFGLQPELQYSMQGGKDKEGTEKFDYVNLPVILKIYVLKRDLSIDVGAQPGYLLSAKRTGMGDVSDIFDNKFDVAVALGASYKFADRFHVGLRYNIGAIKLVDRLNYRNRVSQLFIGIRL